MKISEILDEAGAGPSRIFDHIHDGTPFVMVTGFRREHKHAENQRRNARLKHILKGLPLSYIETGGEYQELGATTPKAEESIFLMPRRGDETVNADYLRQVGVKLLHTFDQESIVYGDGEMIWLIFNDGSKISLGDRATFSPKVINDLDGFSKIKDRKFSYTTADKAPNAVIYGQKRRDQGDRASSEPELNVLTNS